MNEIKYELANNLSSGQEIEKSIRSLNKQHTKNS